MGAVFAPSDDDILDSPHEWESCRTHYPSDISGFDEDLQRSTIAVFETYIILILLITKGPEWANKELITHTDNQSTLYCCISPKLRGTPAGILALMINILCLSFNIKHWVNYVNTAYNPGDCMTRSGYIMEKLENMLQPTRCQLLIPDFGKIWEMYDNIKSNDMKKIQNTLDSLIPRGEWKDRDLISEWRTNGISIKKQNDFVETSSSYLIEKEKKQ
jgi:hypothetical protein